MSMASIRKYYGVPAKRDMRIVMDGRPGVITGTTHGPMYLRVRFDDEPRFTLPIHPTWEVEYPKEETK